MGRVEPRYDATMLVETIVKRRRGRRDRARRDGNGRFSPTATRCFFFLFRRGGGGGKGRQEYTSRWNSRTLDFRIALFPFLLGRISWIYIGVGGIRGGICSEVFLRLKNRDIVGSIR